MLASGKQACLFGLGPSDENDDIVFGYAFLRSAYVVYQLDKKLIGLGQSNFNSASSNFVEIPRGENLFGTIGVTASAASVSAIGTSLASTKPGHTATTSADATSPGTSAAITGTTTSVAGVTYTSRSASATSTGNSGAGVQYAGVGLAAVAGIAAFAL